MTTQSQGPSPFCSLAFTLKVEESGFTLTKDLGVRQRSLIRILLFNRLLQKLSYFNALAAAS